jgi:hypothetical protein
MFAGMANTKTYPPAAAGNNYLCRARRRACPLERQKVTFKRSHVDRRNRQYPFQKAAEVFYKRSGHPRHESIHQSERLAVNLTRTSFMMPQYMKNGLLCQEE